MSLNEQVRRPLAKLAARALRPLVWRAAVWCLLLCASGLVQACAGSQESRAPALSAVKAEAQRSGEAEAVGRWLLGELLSNGGSAEGAQEAKKRLLELKERGMVAELALGLEAFVHGRLKDSAEHYVRCFAAAREARSEDAPLFAWFALGELVDQRREVSGLFRKHQALWEQALAEPKSIGWRARLQLQLWRASEQGGAFVERAEGCLTEVSLSGPFGVGTASEVLETHQAAEPGPWPREFAKSEGQASAARVLEVERRGCQIYARSNPGSGVFYAQSFLQLTRARELVLAPQGAYAIWVNDVLVHERDPRIWGSWLKWGVSVKLPPGRHRVVVKLAQPATAFRFFRPDGAPFELSSAPAAAAYSLERPEVLEDPNLLSRFYTERGALTPKSDILRVLAAELANRDGQGDVATLLLAPLVADRGTAGAVALERAAGFVAQDPLYGGSMQLDRAKDLELAALARDPGLFRPRLNRVLAEAETKGPAEAVAGLLALTQQFPEVARVWLALFRAYGQLGWQAEQAALIKRLLSLFPEQPEVLAAGVEVLEAEGDTKRAAALVSRLAALEPESELELGRALERKAYGRALEELSKLRAPPKKGELELRRRQIERAAGLIAESRAELEEAVNLEPQDNDARLALADAELAGGDQRALIRAAVGATQAGASAAVFEDSIDLISGTTEMEPYRLSAKTVIADYEARGQHQPGVAARVLDYAVLWVRTDGSARMLEHEIIRIQSAEAISQFAEHSRSSGLVLHLRVIKQDGRVLEPEDVQGKPTVTFPHLEVGDYIETEHIYNIPSSSLEGETYLGPRWYFREENVAYARSEWAVISPKHRELIIETRGAVPPPQIEDLGSLLLRRWRVDSSPQATLEPFGPSIDEFLPSVHVGWGVNAARRLSRLAKELQPTTAIDPRLRALAAKITRGAESRLEKARALYRWVHTNVQPGDASDGRQVIITREGNPWRALMELGRAADLSIEFALARSKLAPEPLSPLSEEFLYSEPVLRVRTEQGDHWLWMNSKHAPFGFIPAEVRGASAFVLTEKGPERAVADGRSVVDEVVYSGQGRLSADGTLALKLDITYSGLLSVRLRAALESVPKARLREVLASQLVAQVLEGARASKVSVSGLDSPDAPLSVHAELTVPRFALRSGQSLVLTPPFARSLAQLAGLPTRQTPLILGDAGAQKVQLSLLLPAGARVTGLRPSGELRDAGRQVRIADRFEGGTLHLVRHTQLDIARVEPADYPAFQSFARVSDSLLAAALRIEL